MKMTIDKAITELEVLKKNTFSYTPAHQAFTTAVNIMRKYQKIEKICKRNEYPEYLFHDINEVVEDGKVD